MTSAEVSEQEPLLGRIIRLRAVVLALGEAVQPPWWRTGFLNETGLRFLERLYPRSAFRAAVHAAGMAACEVHDQAIGLRGVFHLFRLPERIEIALRDQSVSFFSDLAEELRPDLGNMDLLLDRLGAMAQRRPIDSLGPKRIGTLSDLFHTDSFREVSSVYFSAFSSGRRAFPYFEIDRERG